ncbi:protein ABHD11-like [Cylas formicarius]|uniref:protein ABHD11-like n=1 Tax=Cylas formicarius TaxID=197179 RepID=UPI0029585D0E|nr:protein ABHD11-like [Cylas formicarius]
MALASNFCKICFSLFVSKFRAASIRCKSDFSAETEFLKYTVELSYSSYQSTESILAKEKPDPLVILHGLLGSRSNFNSLCKKYCDNEHFKRQVFALDLRNHGDSPHCDDQSYDNVIIDLLRFFQRLELHKVSILGHDIGGRAGMLFALKYPELVEKLIVIDMSPITTSHNFTSFADILYALSKMSFPSNLPLLEARAYATAHLSKVIKSKGIMNFILMNLVQKSDTSYTWRFNAKTLLKDFKEISTFPVVHNITFEGPVLFVGGAKSDYIQKSDYPKILKLFPNAELKYIEGAGHWVHSEKPNEFLSLTLEFLNKDQSAVN